MKSRFGSSPSGSTGTFTRLAFEQFRAGLYRYLLRKLRRAEDAEDLTQEVYLRLLRAADHQLVRNPQAYVFGVAFNVLYEFRLHERQDPISYDSDMVARSGEELSDQSASPHESYDQYRRQKWLNQMMAQLSPMQQAVLLMAKRQGLAHAQIAVQLGISVGTVRKHLARAVSACRKTLDEVNVR